MAERAGGSAAASFSAPATPLASARRPEDASAVPPRRLTAAERALERGVPAAEMAKPVPKPQEVKRQTRKGPHLTINLKNANNAAAIVREVAVGEMKWREASTLEASCNANLYWYERAISVDVSPNPKPKPNPNPSPSPNPDQVRARHQCRGGQAAQ